MEASPAVMRKQRGVRKSSHGKGGNLLVGNHQTRYAEVAVVVLKVRHTVRHTMHLIKLLLYVYLVLKAPKDPSEKETDMYDKKLLRKGSGKS